MSITNIKINNKIYSGQVIKIPFSHVIINWNFKGKNPTVIQNSFEVRISDNKIGWGTDNFQPNITKRPMSLGSESFWRLNSKFIERGNIYYGQIRIKDTDKTVSNWNQFSFNINRIPFVFDVSIFPSDPLEKDNLDIIFSTSQDSIKTNIRWFVDGVHFERFDDFNNVSSTFLTSGEIWRAEITPFDEIERGSTVSTDSVKITKLAPEISEVEILPKRPVVDDILEARFTIIDPNINKEIKSSNSEIRWFVNDEIINLANDSKFVRLNIKVGDKIRFTILPKDGSFSGELISSNTVTIISSEFRITNLRVEGSDLNVSVSTPNPVIEWSIFEPEGRKARYSKIQIGNAPFANNVFETIIQNFDGKFTIPNDIVLKGGDYYVSVFVSDTNDLFINGKTAKFRVSGSLWNEKVKNDVGWTIEISLKLLNADKLSFIETKNIQREDIIGGNNFQKLSISDGMRFHEVRFYNNAVQLLTATGKVITRVFSVEEDFSKFNSVIITGKNDTVKIFLLNTLVIEAIDISNQSSSDRFLEIGSGINSNAIGQYKYIKYTIEGNFEPGISSKYSEISFEKVIEFKDSSVDSVYIADGNMAISVNPFDSLQSGSVYSILEDEKSELIETQNSDTIEFSVNSSSISKNNKFIGFSHSKGLTILDSYFIPEYDVNASFFSGSDPSKSNFELIRTIPFAAASFTREGLIIDTTFSNTARLDTRQIFGKINASAVLITWKLKSVESMFSIFIEGSGNDRSFIVSLNNKIGKPSITIMDIPLANKTIGELVNILKENIILSFLWQTFTDITILNNSAHNPATSLYNFPPQVLSLTDSVLIKGNIDILDPYAPNPYSFVSGGKWFYTHRKHGTPWFDRVNNVDGWTVDFDFTLDNVEDNDFPSETEGPSGIGLYLNDGSFYETINFLPQEVIFTNANKTCIYDTTTFSKYRLTGKKNNIKLYAKKDIDPNFSLICEVPFDQKSTNSGNAGRVSITEDSFGNLHATWHDDGNKQRQIYYAKYDKNNGWEVPELVLNEKFSSSHSSIAVDGNGQIYILFETQKADYTDICVVIRNDLGWSDPLFLTSDLFDSKSSCMHIDSQNNVHIAWADYRGISPEIRYASRIGASGQWTTKLFGGEDIQVSRSENGGINPSIISNNDFVYISWTNLRTNGSSSIVLSYKNISSGKWISSGQNGNDFFVTSITSDRPDYSNVFIDLLGKVYVVWHDVINGKYQLFSRIMSSNLLQADNIDQLTVGSFDSRFAKGGLNKTDNNLYVVFEKERQDFIDPYNPYFNSDISIAKSTSQVYIIKYNSRQKLWESSNIVSNRQSGKFGGFDARIFVDDLNTSRRPSIPKLFSGKAHIVYEFQAGVSANDFLLNRDTFTVIKDSIFNLSYKERVIVNEYSDNFLDVSKNLLTKEIRFGDFSSNVSARFIIKNFKYYLKDAVEPFSMRLVSPATVDMPLTNINSSIINNRGDAWLATSSNMLFYNFKENSINILKQNISSESSPILFGIEDLNILDVIFDKSGSIYVLTKDKIFISIDHVYFFEIKLDSTGTASFTGDLVTFAIDSNRKIYIGTSGNGVFILELKEAISSIEVTSSNIAISRSIIADSFENILHNENDINTISENNISIIKIDNNDVVWIGTKNNGLNRYLNGIITRFFTTDGLSSNSINDIAIRNRAIRYIATSMGISKMIGSYIEKLNLRDINIPVNSLDQVSPGEVFIPVFFNVSSIIWREPNILFVSSVDKIYQITFLDDNFLSEQTKITIFDKSDVSLSNIDINIKNDGLKLFNLVNNKSTLTDDVMFEVFLNGNAITTGFSKISSGNALLFNYPLKSSDNVVVNVRNDIKLLNNFSQNVAEEIFLGKKATHIDKVISSGKNTYVVTGGDVQTLQINDEITDLPFDKIILDTTPPQGKIIIKEQLNQTVVKVGIEKLDGTGNTKLPFDETSGIDRMVVSNFDNFTIDGKLQQESIPFVTSINHDLGLAFSNISRQFVFTNENGRSIARYNKTVINAGIEEVIPTVYAGSGSPAKIYALDNITGEWIVKANLDESHLNAEVEFIIDFNGILVIGTGVDGGIANIYMSSDGESFVLAGSLNASHAYSAAIFNGDLYIGTGGFGGKVFRYDGNNFVELFSGLSDAVYDIAVSDTKIFASTGSDGKIYELDIDNNTSRIIHVDNDNDIFSIESTDITGSELLFAGTGSSAKILRSNLSTAFITSFSTIPDAVRSLKEIGIDKNKKIYAAIGKNIYSFSSSSWNIVFNHEFEIYDISDGIDGTVFFISEGDIYKISQGSGVKNVYLKLIDKAGNETMLFDDGQQINDNLFDSISIKELVEFTNRNKIIEVDEFGKTVFSYSGKERFYSANKVDEEKGTYFSEIFNGTNGHIFWDRINLDVNIPENTFITISIRTAITKDQLLDSDFFVVKNASENNDIDLQFLVGQYLQFKIDMVSRIRGMSPSIRRVILRSIAADAVHFFTTNFVLSSRVKSGIMTSQKMIPIASDVIFGIDTNNNLDFSEYQIVDENRIFTTSEKQIGKNLRVGIRFITPSRSEAPIKGFGDYGPYDTILDSNAVEWVINNNSNNNRTYHFRIIFYSDSALNNEIYSVSSKEFVGQTAPTTNIINPLGWSADGEQFEFAGHVVEPNADSRFSFTPVGDNPLLCNTFYFIKIESIFIEDLDWPLSGSPEPWKEFSSNSTFVESCGVTFVDRIDFDMINNSIDNNFDFRIRFYIDEERTNLIGTVFSANDQSGWLVDNMDLSNNGQHIISGETVTVTFVPSLSSQTFIKASTTYFLSIDAFDGIDFILNSNSFTFRSRKADLDSQCGPYIDVPVVNNFAIMFELENNDFITLNID